MSEIWHSISGVLIILGLVGTGFAVIKYKVFNDDDGRLSKFLSGFVTKIAIPAYLMVNIPQDFTTKSLIAMGPRLILPFVSMMILLIISYLAVYIVHVDKNHTGMFQSLFFNSNTITVGLPVNMALFGEKSLPYILIYFMANTTVFWTLGVFMIERDIVKEQKFNLFKTLKGIMTPPMIGLFVAILMVIFNLRLPGFVETDLADLGNTNTALSLIFIGFSLAKTQGKDLIPDRECIALATGRFILAPLVMYLVMLPFNLPPLLKTVFIVQAAMPTMANAAVMARELHADARFASISITQTTLMMLVVIPILMVIINK